MQARCDAPTVVQRDRRSLFETDRYEDARDYVGVFSKPFALASPRARFPLSVSHRRDKLTSICFDLLDVRCETRFEIAGPRLGDRYLIQFSLDGECLVEQAGERRRVGTGGVFVINPFAPSRKMWSGGCKQIMLWIDRSALEDVLAQELEHRIDRELTFELAPDDASGQRENLFCALRAIAADLHQLDPGLDWRSLRQFERWIMLTVLTSLPHSYSTELERGDCAIAPYYVRRVMNHLRGGFSESICMQDVIAASGVSARSLFYGFKRFLGTTPMAYLKATRLDEARRRLLKAPDPEASVTAVASSCGFTHLSQFSRDYKRRFGETPSETRKRAIT